LPVSIDEFKFFLPAHQGYSGYVHKGEGRLRVHPKSVRELKEKISKVTGRSIGMSIETRKPALIT